MSWLDRLAELRASRTPAVLVTVAAVRGSAPRPAGTKMIVTADDQFGTIGGGDLEARAARRARELLAASTSATELLEARLTPDGGEEAVQCCGGEVTVLLEPFVEPRPTVAVFGAGHVGSELVRVLAGLPIDIVVVDGRADRIGAPAAPAASAAGVARRLEPVPEAAIDDLPAGAHLVILTHDHAEDLAVLDAALRRERAGPAFGFVGLIGSKAKWSRFRGRLREAGHDEDALARVTTPLGLPGVPGKRPPAIALATAAQLVGVLDHDLPEGD